jgi:hypothetical protein
LTRFVLLIRLDGLTRNSQEKGNPMAKRTRSKKKRTIQVSDAQLIKDAKKALRKTEKKLEAELKEVKGYLKALDGHNSFTI